MSRTHGHSGKSHNRGQRRVSPEYTVWSSMVQRCTNPRVSAYAQYGGRGIRVCDRWLNSFEAFLADVGPRPSLDHTLDRYPDNDGDYVVGNVRWATRVEQHINSSRARLITIGGVTKRMKEWAIEAGISYWTFRSRLTLGYSPEEAISPVVGRWRFGGNRESH